jgi:hypothetical protein
MLVAKLRSTLPGSVPPEADCRFGEIESVYFVRYCNGTDGLISRTESLFCRTTE